MDDGSVINLNLTINRTERTAKFDFTGIYFIFLKFYFYNKKMYI